jgi:parallel beta-helix repeat protein
VHHKFSERIKAQSKERKYPGIINARLLVALVLLALMIIVVFSIGAIASVDKGKGALSNGTSTQPSDLTGADVMNSASSPQGKGRSGPRPVSPAVATNRYVDPAGTCGGNSPCYTTIQAAINASTAGDTINAYAGTYAEQIDVNKALTLLGPNAGIDPNTGARVAEAVIIPTASNPLDPGFGGPIVVTISADGVTFKGFTVDGDNPSLTSGVSYNGADVDAEFGIYGTETSNPNAVISNNIVRNIGEIATWLNSFGAPGGARTAGSQISNNLVDNCFGAYGQGIRISDDAWVDILNNVVTRVRVGIVIENYSSNVTTHPASVIGNNNISAFRIGIRHNLHYAYTAPGFTISNNTVNPYVQSVRPPQVTAIESPVTAFQGIRVESVQQTVFVTVTGNTLAGNRSALTSAGYTRDEGLMLTNAVNTSPNILFKLNSVTDFIRGAFNETPAVPDFECNNFAGNTTGVYLSSNATNGLIAHNNNITGNGFGMQNDGPAIVNAQGNWWGTANGPGPVGPGSGDKVSTNVDYSNWLTSTSNCPPPCPTNVARSSYGATAVASSEYNASFPASGVIDGEHDGNNWGSGGGWNDRTRGVFPDNVQINLNVTQTLDAIDVYTLKDQPNNGSTVGDFTTFNSYGITDFDVQYWNGSAWVTVPGGSITGNNRVKRRFSFSTPITTDRIRVLVNSSADLLFSRVVEVEAFSCSPVAVPTPTPTPSPSPTPTPSPTPCTNPGNNVARSTNGSTAVASSTVNANFPASGAIDGEHNGNTWGSGGGWNDGTRGVFPDNVQVNFNTNQTLREIDVYTLKDNFNSGSVVTDTTTFNSYGIRNFNVQYWTGSAWVDVPGGAVTGNTLVKRKFIFPDITTDKIRVVVNDSADHLYSRVVEIEAFSCVPVAVRCVNNGGTGGCFSTIQAAINASSPGDTVSVQPGTYDEDVTVNKANLQLLGSGANVTNIRGVFGGDSATVRAAANNVTIAGFTITRLGNNTTDWNNPALNSVGIAVQGQAITGMLVRDNILTGNRSGIDVNDSSGHTIRNNVIDFNRTGIIYGNRTDNQTVVENFITNNWTVGVLFLDRSNSGTPPQQALHSTFSNNSISANWYGQIVDRQSGGSLPAPATTNYKNFRGNWFGTISPVITTANSAEPGYAAQIPVAYGGTATPPGGQPDIAGPASANFQIIPFLQSGTDTNVETTPGRGTFGFQGVPNTVVVSPANQNGWVFFDDNPGTGTGSGGFEPGPATPPLGTGSAFLTVDSQGRYAVATAAYAGTRMDDLAGLLYSSYQNNNSNTVVAISLQFDIDYDLNDTTTNYQGRLVFEPYLTGTVQQNVWQNWNPRAGNWYGTRTTVPVNNVNVAQPCQPATPCTYQQVLALFPNAGVWNSGGGVLFKAGGPWSPGFDGNFDALTIRHGGSLINYNFEHVP